VNLAGPDRPFRHASIKMLASELQAAGGFGATLVNVHAGSHRETSLGDGIRRLASGVAQALDRAGDPERPSSPLPAPVLVLENAAGSGSAIGTTIAELARIADRAAGLGVPEGRLAFCLDTAHAWGAGIDLGDPEAVDRWLETFDRELGLARLALVHLNDSRSELGSRLDRHEHIGAGRIPVRGLRHLLNHPALHGRPVILETPGMEEGYDLVNLQRARALAAGDALAPLPEAAFRLSRGQRHAGPGPDDGDEADAAPGDADG
jgi:deoxyribonuclease IV